MKPFAIGLILEMLLFAPAAFSAEWQAIPNAGSVNQYFYDRSKLTIKDDQITYWKKVIFKAPQQIHGKDAASGLLRERIDCSEHTAKLVSYLYYSAANETIEYQMQDDSDPTPIIPDTVGDAFEKALCPIVWHKQEENRIKAEQKAAAAELAASSKNEDKPAESKPDKTAPPATAVASPPAPANNQAQPAKPEAQPRTEPPKASLPTPQIIEQLY